VLIGNRSLLILRPIDPVFAILVNTLFAAIARNLRLAGGWVLVAAWGFGVVILWSVGVPGYVPFVLFVGGSAAAGRAGLQRKQSLGISVSPIAVLSATRICASCLPPTICAVAVVSGFFQPSVLLVASVAGFASALADVASGELGTLMNAHPVRLLTMQKTYPGASGAVSLMGTIDALAAACLIALAGWLARAIGFADVWVVMVAACVGNLVDTVLGGTFFLVSKNDGAPSRASSACRDFFATSVACAVGAVLARVTQ